MVLKYDLMQFFYVKNERLCKMSNQELLKQYKNEVDNVRKSAKELGLSKNQVNAIFRRCILNLKKATTSSKPKKQTKAQKFIHILIYIFLLFTTLTFFFYILLNVHQPTTSIVLRNVQGLTYPTLKVVRFLFVPIIKLFPSLTDLYDESCLLENPYFYVADMECWPCENVNAVLDITEIDGKNSFNSGSGAPFIVKTNQNSVTIKALKDMYKENKEVFITEARKIKSTNTSITSVENLFSNLEHLMSSNTHTSWRINKMMPARIIRNLFPRPSFISPRSGQSVERFVLIDGAKGEPYILPNTECSYVFLIQSSGERTIVLKPSKECSHTCKTVSVILKPSYVCGVSSVKTFRSCDFRNWYISLQRAWAVKYREIGFQLNHHYVREYIWYNWWYWKPISLPAENSTGLSIGYINSYC